MFEPPFSSGGLGESKSLRTFNKDLGYEIIIGKGNHYGGLSLMQNMGVMGMVLY